MRDILSLTFIRIYWVFIKSEHNDLEQKDSFQYIGLV